MNMTEYEHILSQRLRAMHARLAHLCLDKQQGVDTMRMIQIYAGMACELLLEYDMPGEMMAEFVGDVADALRLPFDPCEIEHKSLPPVYVLDREIEFGRSFSREITLEEWDDVHAILKILGSLIAHDFTIWEEQGFERDESLSLLHECLRLALAFEFAAQDMCDIMIEEKIAKEQWSLGDCIVAMSGIAGWKIGGIIQDTSGETKKTSNHLPHFEQMLFVMTQEAIRLGVEAGTDWRAGMPANDYPVQPPVELIESAMPLLEDYAQFLAVTEDLHVAGIIAKACGRMLAVASGGDFPEIEPSIAKTLSMMALSESYRYQDQQKALSKI